MNNPAPSATASPLRQRGFSLIELMIAMALSLSVIATVGYVFVGAKASFNTMEALATIQENARYAFEFMAKDIRMAGFTGGPTTGQDLVGSTSWDNLKDLYQIPLLGYEDGATVPDVSPNTGTDALTVIHADNDFEYPLYAALSGTQLKLNCPTDGIPLPVPGEIFVISDYTKSALFKIQTAVTCTSDPLTVTSSASFTGLSFGGGFEATSIYRLRGATYYIADNDAGEPTLFRHELGADDAGNTAAIETEILAGVQDMEILYGVDASDPADGVIDYDYKTATEVGALAAEATTEKRWKRVRSVRVTLTLLSRQGTNVTTTGGQLTKTFTNTIAVRNRL